MEIDYKAWRHPTESPCEKLWRSVIETALSDLKKPKYLEAALKWFEEESDEPGSLYWICTELGIERPGLIRQHARNISGINRPKRPEEIVRL